MKFLNIDIKKLFLLMEEHDIAEVNLRDGKLVVEVIRKRTTSGYLPAGMTPVSPDSAEEKNPISATPTNTLEQPIEETEVSDNYYQVKAPLVGTFYQAPTPDADPFVEVGDRVQKGDVICIVEAMKSMNEIQTDVSGVIKEICVKNAELIEFDQVLLKIDTSA